MNRKPFEHTSSWGTRFTGERCDLSCPIQVEIDQRVYQNPLQLANDVGEFIAWHRCAIWDQLNGFSGYGNLNYQFNVRDHAST